MESQSNSIPEIPDIESLDELVDRAYVAKLFNVSEPSVDQWRYGRNSAAQPLPYFRLGRKVWLWRGGIIWWLNQQRKRPDLVHIDRMRRTKEGIKVGKPRPKRNSKR